MNEKSLDTKLIINNFISHVIQKHVSYIRNEFSNEFNVNNGCFKNYRGLSYDMSEEFINKIKSYIKESNLSEDLGFSIKRIEGYPKLIKKRESNSTIFHHHWVEVSIFSKRIYVDLCSQEFKDLYKDIPDYYVGFKKPKWYFKYHSNDKLDNFILKVYRPILNKIIK